MSRRSYGKLLHMPAWGLYDGDKLNATIRAPSEEAAKKLFEAWAERPSYKPYIRGDRVMEI